MWCGVNQGAISPSLVRSAGGSILPAIFCIGENLRGRGEFNAPGLSGYTLAFSDDADANEIEFARAVAGYLGVKVREVIPAQHDATWYADLAAKFQDFPGFPNGATATSLYSEASADGHRVVLGGSGGDHVLFGSLAYYFEELVEANFATVWRLFAEDAHSIGIGRSLARFARHGLVPFVPKFARDCVRPIWTAMSAQPKREAFWLSARLQKILRQRREQWNAPNGSQVAFRGQLGLVHSLGYAFDAFGREVGERIGAVNGIEFRAPFFSRNDRIRVCYSRSPSIAGRLHQDYPQGGP